MSDEKKVDESVEAQIKRISNNFESDVLRLIKTQSMIQSSEEIINDEVEYLKNNIELIGSKLDEISIKTSEINEIIHLSSENNNHKNTHFERYLNEYLDLLTAHNNELKKLKSHLEDRLSHGSASLKSLQKYYIAELKAFEQEVDTNLNLFREEMNEKIKPDITDFADDSSVDQTEAPKKPPSDETDKKEYEEAKASSEQVAKYNHKKEREYLEQEFKQYKERFESHPRVDKSIKKEEVVRDDEYYEKMFASSTAGFNSRQQQSIGFNKFIFAMLLIIWVIAIISFYLFFIDGNGFKKFSTNGTTDDLITSEEIKDIDIEIQAGGLEDKKINAPVIKPPDKDVDLEVAASADGDPAEKKESEVLAGSEDTKTETLAEVEDTVAVTKPIETVVREFDYEVVVNKANIRKGPSKKYSIVGTLYRGQKVESLDESKGVWMKIRSEYGYEGWMGKRLLKKSNQ